MFLFVCNKDEDYYLQQILYTHRTRIKIKDPEYARAKLLNLKVAYLFTEFLFKN
jgi:hypothetical protein